MRIDIISAVPKLLDSPLSESIVKRAREKGVVEIYTHDLREFGQWLILRFPDVASSADLEQSHIEAYKTWLVTTPRKCAGGKPLNRVSVKNALINLHCFFDRITDWGYPNPPQRPLVFAGDLPIIDKPLPRFLDDAAAAKLLRTARQDTDPFGAACDRAAGPDRHASR